MFKVFTYRILSESSEYESTNKLTYLQGYIYIDIYTNTCGYVKSFVLSCFEGLNSILYAHAFSTAIYIYIYKIPLRCDQWEVSSQ